MCRVQAFLLVLATTLRDAAAMINAGTVVVIPCGVLEMEVS